MPETLVHLLHSISHNIFQMAYRFVVSSTFQIINAVKGIRYYHEKRSRPGAIKAKKELHWNISRRILFCAVVHMLLVGRKAIGVE